MRRLSRLDAVRSGQTLRITGQEEPLLKHALKKKVKQRIRERRWQEPVE